MAPKRTPGPYFLAHCLAKPTVSKASVGAQIMEEISEPSLEPAAE
jgi:hypothetical protein